MSASRLASEQRLDHEIAMLRQRLEGAEDMRRAITAGEVDGFVVGHEPEQSRVVLLQTSMPGPHGVLERIQQGAATVAQSGEILYANQRFAAMLDEPLSELFGASLPERAIARDRTPLVGLLGDGVADTHADVVLKRRDGSTFEARVSVVSCTDGYASILVTEESTRERLEEAARALEAIQNGDIDAVVVGGERVMLLDDAHRPYHAMVDRMQQGALTVSPAGEVLYANQQFAAMAGVASEALLGEAVQRFFAPGDRALLDTLMRDVPADGAMVELTIVRPDATTLAVGITAAAVPASDAVTLVLTDLSEQRRHQEIEEAGKRKDEFLAVLGHELRNPLAPIRNAVEILERMPELDPDARYAVHVIDRQTATLARLVDDLLDVHRLNRGKLNLKRRPLDIAALVRSAVEAAEPQVRELGHRLELELPDRALWVNGDAVRLTQVLVNLVGNAAKYTPRGGVVRVSLAPVHAGGIESVRMRVADSGIGIPAEHIGGIFEPYVQVRRPGEDIAQGLGLGLSVARRLVEMHEGTIRAESAGAGQGSAFEVELPCCPAEDVVDTAPAEASSPRTPRRILLADDNVDSVQSLAMLLEMQGYETRMARDGLEALAIADHFRPQVCVLDLGMPNLDGYATARALRRRPWARDLALFALSGWGQAEDLERARQAGFDRHLVKPLDPDALTRLIESADRPPG